MNGDLRGNRRLAAFPPGIHFALEAPTAPGPSPTRTSDPILAACS